MTNEYENIDVDVSPYLNSEVERDYKITPGENDGEINLLDSLGNITSAKPKGINDAAFRPVHSSNNDDEESLVTYKEFDETFTQSDWDETNSSSKAFIKNKPIIPSGSGSSPAYAYCPTGASTTEKVVTTNDFKLLDKQIIFINFGQGHNEGVQFKLNINGTGAKTVKYLGYPFTDNIDEEQTVGFVYRSISGYYEIMGVVDSGYNKVSSSSILKIVKLTQAQYDALSTKNEQTLYIVVG